MLRLQVVDRKRLHGAAMICGELWNSAGMTVNRDRMPDGVGAMDFLPELPEERARRLAEEAIARNTPINPQAFALWKEKLLALGKKKL